MNFHDILKYGHLMVGRTLDDLNEAQCQVNGVCGRWSVRDIMAHLASYELFHADVLSSFLNDEPTPYLADFMSADVDFNNDQVDSRQQQTMAETVAEYNAAQARVTSLAAQLPAAKLAEVGTIPWYGADYSLDDLFVYTSYGHKREHVAQINVYKDTLK